MRTGSATSARAPSRRDGAHEPSSTGSGCASGSPTSVAGASGLGGALVTAGPGGTVKSHTLIWGAGLMANPIVHALGVELVKGRLPVGPKLNLVDRPEVFVIGDNAIITDGRTNEQLPQLGSVALQSGEHAGATITGLVQGKQTGPFKYRDKGTMATIGYGAAIAQLPLGRTLHGEAAWVSWLGVHLMLLSGGKQRGQTLLDWGNNVLENARRKGHAGK